MRNIVLNIRNSTIAGPLQAFSITGATIVAVMPLLFCSTSVAFADTSDADSSPETWSLHGQTTVTDQYHPAFKSPYRGTYSLDPGSRGDETVDATVYAGLRLWDGGEAYINPEIDQGFGLSNTLGVAGFLSGEAYKIGKAEPYGRLHRLFFRQTFELGGDEESIAPDANQLGSTRTHDNFIITAGKIAVTDIFDGNAYAHDPKINFLNWSIVDGGAYDYAADSWGFSYGIAGEWTQSWWTLRVGLFDMSRVPNMPNLVRGFGQYELVTEAEERHKLWGQNGELKVLLYVNRGRMGDYNDAVNLALATQSTPSTALVRKPASRPGMVINLEQQLTDNLGAFARASINDGSKEGFDFTDIDRSLSLGLSLKGAAWGRPDDTIGFAGVVNAISDSARRYFALGGLGILIGDGQLPHYHTEDILETYYSVPLTAWLTATADYQFVANPAYNSDRGPVSVFGVRLHAQL